jgi:hypothetical protein
VETVAFPSATTSSKVFGFNYRNEIPAWQRPAMAIHFEGLVPGDIIIGISQN